MPSSVSFNINPSEHKSARTQGKIRARAEKGSTAGEQAVAQSKLKRPETLPKLKEEKKGMSKDEMLSVLKNHQYSKQQLLNMSKKSTKEGRHGEAAAFYHEFQKEEYISEREMTSGEMQKEKKLKQKYDDSGMKASMISQYGPKRGPKVYFATIRSKAMKKGANEEYSEIYNSIIKNLTENHYAKNYAAAEIMVEHFSDEFMSCLVEEYIEEKARGTRAKSTVHAYDVDETLFSHGKGGRPNVKVHVNDASGKRVHSLTNQEFNTHKLEKGHSYDFSEFRSAKKFAETGKPNKKVIKDLKRRQARGQNVHLITARDKFDDPKAFHSHLQKHGINVHPHNIHYTGGMKGSDIGDKKVTVANAIAKKHKATHIHMHDDAPKVHKAFEKEKQSHPTTKKVSTHLIKPDKSGEPKSRSYQATKEEMSSYEFWKQFIDE